MAKTKTPRPRPVRQKKSPLPPYVKRWQDLRRTVEVGNRVTITRRIWNSGWTMKELTGVVREVTPNCLILNPKVPGTPWYVIHDFEIHEKVST